MTIKKPDLGSENNYDDDNDENDEILNEREDIHVTFEAINKKIEQINLLEAEKLKNLAHDYKDVLGETTSSEHYSRTLLHFLVDGATSDRFSKYEPLVKAIIENHPDVLKKGDATGKTSLYNAVTKKRSKLVRFICNTHPDINSVFEQTCVDTKETCIHAAIHKSLSPNLAIFLIKKASEKVLCLQDYQGKTPLHSAVQYKRCTDQQLQIVQALAERGGGAMRMLAARDDVATRMLAKRGGGPMKIQTEDFCLSPYKYHMHTRAEAENAAKNTQEYMKESTQGTKLKDNPASWEAIVGKSGDGGDFKSPSGGELKTSMASVASSSQKKSMNVETLDKSRHPSHQRRLSYYPGSPTLPYGGIKNTDLAHGMGERLRDSLDENPEPKFEERNTKKSRDTDARVAEESAEAIRKFLMLHCMRTMSTKDAEDFLYEKDQGKEISFDLSDEHPLEITEDQINIGYSRLEFEKVLRYVAFPNFQIEKRSVRSRGKQVIEPDGSGRDDMTVLFQFLRREKVERIIHVIVDDRDKIPHSDGAIDIALRGLKVERWDWQKFDICMETIASAAPDVEQIHLYWSGNNAVLRGWSDKEVLKRMTKLKTIYLHVTQGLETAERTKINAIEFKKRIELQDIQVELPIDDPPLHKRESSNISTKTDQDQRARRHQWLKCMDEFADFIRNLEPFGASYQPVNVALIDDGVDMKEKSLYDKLLRGKSFRSSDDEQDRSDSHYVKSGGHGTAMASLICRVCPNAKIMPLKLDEGKGKSKRQIIAESAAESNKALEYAVEKRVDIISMSWTIEATADNGKSIERLKKAVEEAAKNNILMFCAASDGGAISDKSFPGKAPRDSVFKIGAATEDGKAWKWVGDESNIDFIFPGHEVVLERYEDALLHNSNLLTGSSVATAIAAGLAALVLDCVRLAALHYEGLLDQQKELTSSQPTQRGTQQPRDPAEELKLQKRKRDVDEALEKSKQVRLHDLEKLRAPQMMKDAFGRIGLTDKKYVKVWEVFQSKDAKGKTNDEKMETILCTIASKLKG